MNVRLGLAGLLVFSSLSFAQQGGEPVEKLTDMVPKPFYDVQKVSDGYENKMTLIETGVAGLKDRLDIIRKAEEHIEVEYFIYNHDQSSKLITLELVKAAERGVKVRVLVDASLAVLELDEFLVEQMEKSGIDVRYYNTASILRVSSIQFRNHRKLISVDDKYAITGGRNVEDDYYDMSPEYNFIDRDVLIEGPIVKTMRESFDEFFTHKIATDVKYAKKPRATRRKMDSRTRRWITVPNTKAIAEYNRRVQEAMNFVTEFQEDIIIREEVDRIGAAVQATRKTHVCPETTFSSDMPGGNFFSRLRENYSDNFRGLRKALFDKMSVVNKEVIISSPYMINNKHSRAMMNLFLDHGVRIRLYTNSLASTDAVYVAANLYDRVFDWLNMGIEVNLHSGSYVELSEVPVEKAATEARWGTHSKTMVYISEEDGELVKEIMIGTYNIDNRSNYYNNEMAVFCKGNNELADELIANIENRMDQGYKLNADRTATDKDGNKVSIYGIDTSNLTKMKWLSIPSKLLKFLL